MTTSLKTYSVSQFVYC